MSTRQRALRCITAMLMAPAIASAEPSGERSIAPSASAEAKKSTVTVPTVGFGIGYCTRHDLDVGGTGGCGDVGIGTKFAIPRSRGFWPHAVVEVGAGVTQAVERFDPAIHARSGGMYFLGRILVGVHLRSPAFFRLGGGLRVAAPLGQVVAGGQGIAELGFDAGPFSVGVRATVGQEPMRTIAGDAYSGNALTYETLFFLRVAFLRKALP